MDHYPAQNLTDAQDFIRDFVRALRSHIVLKQSMFVVMCERNTGHFSGSVDEVLQKEPRIYMIQEKIGKNPGVYTGDEMKEVYGSGLRKALKYDRLFFWEDLITRTPTSDACGEIPSFRTAMDARSKSNIVSRTRDAMGRRREEVISEAIEQMMRTRQVPKKSTLNGLTPTRYTFSGKVGPDGKISAGLKDDLMMMICAGFTWAHSFHSRKVPNMPEAIYNI